MYNYSKLTVGIHITVITFINIVYVYKGTAWLKET